MPRRLCSVLLFLAAAAPLAGLLAPPPAAGQDDGNTKVATFRTQDEVSIRGVLHRSAKGPNSPCVILLHQYLADPNKGGFRDLAEALAKKGFHVLRFDFRGHGESTLVNPNQFWNDDINKAYMPRLARKKPVPEKLEPADLRDPARVKPGYYPRLADDVMAARVYLDSLNDQNEVNTSSVYLVGAGDAVNLGFLYVTAEWSRYQKLPALYTVHPALHANPGGTLRTGDKPAGLDVAGAVWLSPARNPAIKAKDLQRWVQFAPEMRERTPMLFLHGEKDEAGKAESRFLRDQVLAAKVGNTPLPSLPLTKVMPVKNANLKGAELLREGLETQSLIVDYLDALERERKNLVRIANRGFNTPPAIYLPDWGVLPPR